MKFRGFYSQAPVQPNISILIFQNSKGDFFRQISTDGKRVSGFQEVSDIIPSRINIEKETEVSVPKIGDLLIYAIEYKKSSYAVGDLESIKNRLKKLLTSNEFKNAPFFALEVALFANMQIEATLIAKNCMNSLIARSEGFAKKWLSGADIPHGIKINILEELDNQKSQEHKRFVQDFDAPSVIRISIPYVLMELIDKNSRENRISRSKFISTYLEKELESQTQAANPEDIFEIYKDINKRYYFHFNNLNNPHHLILEYLGVEKITLDMDLDKYIKAYHFSLLHEGRFTVRLSKEIINQIDRNIAAGKIIFNGVERARGAEIIRILEKNSVPIHKQMHDTIKRRLDHNSSSISKSNDL